MGLSMNSWLVIGVLAFYIASLFACAFYGEKRISRLGDKGRIILLSLTLGVYCSSWTFYGAVGESVRGGIAFLPIYLGPLIFLWLGRDIWQRLGRIRRHQSISSIADFIAARYGKSGILAALVTVLAVIAVLPYLALQLNAISLSTVTLLGEQEHTTHTTFGVLMLTATLTGIAMLFGTRQLASTEQHGGLMLAVAFESAIKLIALLSVAAFALFFSGNDWQVVQRDIVLTMDHIQDKGLPDSFWTQTLLAAAAMICLPRQFHVAVVELRDERHIKGARLLFSIYLLLMVIAIIPIASWALHRPFHSLPTPDMAVLMLPIMHDQTWLALFAFLGGFSAATGMLLVSTLALSIMLSNDLILPLLWRFGILKKEDARLSSWLKIIRRLCIAGVMLLGFIVYLILSDIKQLSTFGLLAFSAVIQFAPALIGGLYWRGGSRQGVITGLIAGFSLWAYTLLWPAILRSMSIQQHPWVEQWLHHGPFGWSWLQPEALFGFGAADPLTHGVLWALGLNVSLFIAVSKRKRPSIAEQMQTENFFQFSGSTSAQAPVSAHAQRYEFEQAQTRLTIGDLCALASRINGSQITEQAFRQFAIRQGMALDKSMRADNDWWRFTEQHLAGAIGAASSRTLLTTALVNDGLSVGQVANILDQASQWQRFNQNLLETMMDHMTQGISVVDASLCLVAWNKRYLELFDYPENFVYVGCPVANLIRYNAERGECGPGSVEAHIQKRLQWMQAGSPHEFERQRPDGRVIEMRGHPIPGGGFVTTYADISVFKKTEAVLEGKVQERTQQLENALYEQQRARQQADIANSSKSRFLAAASHDLLQPMHAARLFAGALEYAPLEAQDKQTLQQLDRALHGAESILSALLDIARLDTDVLKANVSVFALSDLLQDLQHQFSPIAEQRNLTLHVHPTSLWVKTDPQWLRRMIQNFLSNALRYTARGRVVVGVLSSASKPHHIRIGVWDTGPGIAPEQQANLFKEFQRGGHQSPWGEQGIGLGLAIVERMANRLNHRIICISEQGKGACFMLELPSVPAPETVKTINQPVPATVSHLNVLCLDNDPTILQGMQLLLGKWGCTVFSAQTPQQALDILQKEHIQMWLVDQHLDADIEGLDFLIQHNIRHTPAALITADSDPELPRRVKELGFVLLKKPLKPAALRAFLSSMKYQQSGTKPVHF